MKCKGCPLFKKDNHGFHYCAIKNKILDFTDGSIGCRTWTKIIYAKAKELLAKEKDNEKFSS
jgi:hypothetical protein